MEYGGFMLIVAGTPVYMICNQVVELTLIQAAYKKQYQ
jgi:hypothetical protein